MVEASHSSLLTPQLALLLRSTHKIYRGNTFADNSWLPRDCNMLKASLTLLQILYSNTKGKLVLSMNRNKLAFENLFQLEFCEMSSLCVILIIQFNIFQQETKKREAECSISIKTNKSNQNNTHKMFVKLSLLVWNKIGLKQPAS